MIVTAPKKSGIASTYPLIIAAGEVDLSQEWGEALQKHMLDGGTLVVCAGQFAGPGTAALQLPTTQPSAEASELLWKAGREQTVSSNTFRFESPDPAYGQVLAASPDGKPIAVAYERGKGKLVYVGVPLGLGIDRRPVPLLALLMQEFSDRVVPLQVTGDVEWTLSRLEDGGWLIGLLNNRGVNKPQHGVNPTDYSQCRR